MRQGSKEGAGLASSLRRSVEKMVVEATCVWDFEFTAKRGGRCERPECKCVWRDPFHRDRGCAAPVLILHVECGAEGLLRANPVQPLGSYLQPRFL